MVVGVGRVVVVRCEGEEERKPAAGFVGVQAIRRTGLAPWESGGPASRHGNGKLPQVSVVVIR